MLMMPRAIRHRLDRLCGMAGQQNLHFPWQNLHLP
jgi:hypothetical protein